MAVALVFCVFASLTLGSVLKVIGMSRTLPAATLAVSLAMNSSREGGQLVGIATPLAPLPEPATMLKWGMSVGSMAAAAAAALAPTSEASRTVGRAEAPKARRENAAAVVKNCILTECSRKIENCCNVCGIRIYSVEDKITSWYNRKS